MPGTISVSVVCYPEAGLDCGRELREMNRKDLVDVRRAPDEPRRRAFMGGLYDAPLLSIILAVLVHGLCVSGPCISRRGRED